MGSSKCNCGLCGGLGVVLSLLFGAIVGLLFAFEFIPNIVVVSWIAFGLAVLFLILFVGALVLAAVTGKSPLSKCLCANSTCLLVGIIGTLITSIAALAIDLVTTFVSVAVLVGIGAFFFAFMVVGMIALILCISEKLCCVVNQ